jgi:hypothetical protein
MKICILTPRFPFPENGGDVLRINNICRYLKGKNHYLILISFYENEKPCLTDKYKMIYDDIVLIRRKKIVSLISSLIFLTIGRPIQTGYYFSLSYLSKLIKIKKEKNPDLYISHLLRMAPYLEILKINHKSIIEMTDALSKTYSLLNKDTILSLKKIIYLVEKKLINKYEYHVINNFPKISLISLDDIKYLGDARNLRLYSPGINCLESPILKYNKYKICFIGNMRTLQNQDAVIYFIENILPKINEKIPGSVFYIVGADPPLNIRKYSSINNIFITGYVENIYDAVSDSCIAVAPVRIAAGIQYKVLMAMGAYIPVVLTSLISKAIPELKSGENCFISENDTDFTRKCVELMKNADLRKYIAKNGYKTVVDFYSDVKLLDGYENL